ncbi:MAG TPA: nicotinamide mononucleotide transporter [Nitrospirota bacterium]
MTWTILILGIAGQVANIYKSRWCFVAWGICNLCMVWLCWHDGRYPMVALYIIYNGFAVWGWVKWGR